MASKNKDVERLDEVQKLGSGAFRTKQKVHAMMWTKRYKREERSSTGGKWQTDLQSIAFIVILWIVLGVLSDGNFDALTGEAFAKWCGLYHTWEFLCRVHLEHVGECPRENRCFAAVNTGSSLATNINEAHSQAIGSC